MIQLADGEDQDLLIAGVPYLANDENDDTRTFWKSPVVLFLCVALTVLASQVIN